MFVEPSLVGARGVGRGCGRVEVGDVGAALFADAPFGLLVAVAVGVVGAGVGGCFDECPAEIARPLLAEWTVQVALA
jgi:hypothetical protein